MNPQLGHTFNGPIAMNINSLLGNSSTGLTGSGTSASQASSAVSTSSQLFSKADKRIQTDVDSTTAQLSKFGLLKSAVSGTQVAAHVLTALATTASSSDVTTAVGKFFNAFNSAVSAAKDASAVPGSSSALQSAKRVTNDLKRVLIADPATENAMKKLGLTVQKDGTLTHDVKKFAAALSSDPAGVRTALATIGKRVDAAATTELAKNGNVDAEITSLSQHGTSLAAQQKAMKALVAAMANTQSTAATASAAASSAAYTGYGLAAYQANSNGFWA